MLELAIAKAQQAQEVCATEKDVATYIKKAFEENYEKTWHVVVGRNFSTYVTHEQQMYAYFYLGQMGVCIWKTP
ncbi:unnamed protein product [Vitrella brassicaformis CCMP3155]|uniref:Dynein light chain n=1 Tax=Vitrella brassicaformis (strain CCMP3155) TaxID=1169540 RepID=A0A0G4F7G1_VITBC|nr:unnamed protein product [Vitrella brassicaformis CCMP3155]|eukprot:CEM08046.1 unnamed protein product [Vitrella brassicaformis CCMP3155]